MRKPPTFRPAFRAPVSPKLRAMFAPFYAPIPSGPMVTAAPDTPDLAAASDSGASSTDNITNDTTPTFRVGLPPQAIATNVVRVYRAGSVEIGSKTLDGTDISNGFADVTASTLSSGGHTITARVENGVGLSLPSAGLAITVDAVAPDPPTIDLAAASDSGASSTDNVTFDDTPTIDITLPGNAAAGDLLELRESTTVLASKTLDAGDIIAGVVSLTATSLSDGAHTLTARLTDLAGNVGSNSSGLAVTVDTAAASAPTALIVTPADQGSSAVQTDNTQPTFRISLPGNAVSGDVVTLEINTVDNATAALDGTDISNGYVDIQAAAPLADDALYNISAFLTDLAGNVGASNSPVAVEVGDAGDGIPATIENGFDNFRAFTTAPDGAAAGAAWTVTTMRDFRIDDSAMTLFEMRNGTGVVMSFRRTATNTFEFKGWQSDAATPVFSNVTAAVPASTGRVKIVASCNGTAAHLKVIKVSDGTTVTGVNTPGAAGNIDAANSTWYFSRTATGAEYADNILYHDAVAAEFQDLTDSDVLEEHYDSTNFEMRNPGADGSNPFSGQPIVSLQGNAANYLVNSGSGGPLDAGANQGADTSPGQYAEDYAYAAVAVEFDGTNNYITYGDVSAQMIDSKQFTISMWLKFPTWVIDRQIFTVGPNTSSARFFIIAGGTSGVVTLFGRNSAGSTRLDQQFLAFPVNSWGHLLISCDMASGYQIYLNDVDASGDVNSVNFTNDTLDFTQILLSVGSRMNDNSQKLDGYISDFYFNIGTALDISVEANRRKFISAAGKPVYLGATGQLPTGSQPHFLHAGPVASWHTNKGSVTGGTLNGTLTEAPDSPSD